MGQSGVPRPATALEGKTKAVEGAADVQTFTFPDDVSRAEFNFLAANAQAQILRAVRDIEKRLVQIGKVFVRQAWTAVAPFLQAALKLREEPEVRSKMPVGVEKITLQNVSGGGFRVCAKARVFVVLVFVANFAADGEIPILTSQGDVL